MAEEDLIVLFCIEFYQSSFQDLEGFLNVKE